LETTKKARFVSETHKFYILTFSFLRRMSLAATPSTQMLLQTPSATSKISVPKTGVPKDKMRGPPTTVSKLNSARSSIAVANFKIRNHLDAPPTSSKKKEKSKNQITTHKTQNKETSSSSIVESSKLAQTLEPSQFGPSQKALKALKKQKEAQQKEVNDIADQIAVSIRPNTPLTPSASSVEIDQTENTPVCQHYLSREEKLKLWKEQKEKAKQAKQPK
jgi:hypothetical protein